jgi:hypothetical protein
MAEQSKKVARMVEQVYQVSGYIAVKVRQENGTSRESSSAKGWAALLEVLPGEDLEELAKLGREIAAECQVEMGRRGSGKVLTFADRMAQLAAEEDAAAIVSE